MKMVLLTALGVGGSTVVGAVLGFMFKKLSQRFSVIVLDFAAGVMLYAAVIGLVMPSLEYGISLFTCNGEDCQSLPSKPLALLLTIAGIFLGAVCLRLVDRLVPHLHKMAGEDIEQHPNSNRQVGKVLLFVMAIAIHNLPEGLAAGVGFGAGNTAEAMLIAGGIALQNIPEGMVIIGPMLAAGIKPGKTFLIALATGLVEVVGTLIGYLTVSFSSVILPFALAFAGGTMLYIISDEMIPDVHADESARGVTFAMLVGFCVMMCAEVLLG